MTTTIRPAAGDSAVARAGELIALAFDRLAPSVFLVPDPARRQEVLARYFAVWARHAADGAGEVLLLEQDGQARAVAVWFDRTRQIPFPGYDRLLKQAVGPRWPRFRYLDLLLDAFHPGEPHRHLAYLAVHPHHQGKGWGSALLEHTHARLDRDGVPAYLEATDADNHRLYQRHGYEALASGVLRLDDGTTFCRMWRPAGAVPPPRRAAAVPQRAAAVPVRPLSVAARWTR